MSRGLSTTKEIATATGDTTQAVEADVAGTEALYTGEGTAAADHAGSASVAAGGASVAAGAGAAGGECRYRIRSKRAAPTADDPLQRAGARVWPSSSTAEDVKRLAVERAKRATDDHPALRRLYRGMDQFSHLGCVCGCVCSCSPDFCVVERKILRHREIEFPPQERH